MKPILISMDPQALASLNRVAPGKRKRSEFIRKAICDAIRQAEFRAMRDAYEMLPDLNEPGDDWSNAEEFAP